MSTYEEHFPVYLDYDNYEYFRVSRENIEEFNKLKKDLLAAVKNKKPISARQLNDFFEFLKLVSGEELSHYFNQIEGHVKEIKEYLKKEKDYIFKDPIIDYSTEDAQYYDHKGNELEYAVFYSDLGFHQMLRSILFKVLKIDKGRKKPFTKDECIEAILVELLTYRKAIMKEEFKEDYTVYKMAVLAACIANKVFGFLGSTKKLTNPKYFQYSRKAVEITKVNYPELFVGIK